MNTVYWFLRSVSRFAYPLPFCLILLGAGAGLLWFTRKQKLGKALVTVGVLLLLLLSLPPLASLQVRRLERGVSVCLRPSQTLKAMPAESGASSEAVWVVVLGTGFNPNPEYPFTLQVSPGFWSRVLEGVRLYRLCPGSRLMISIPGLASASEKGRFAADLMDFFALQTNRVQIMTEARTTADEAYLARGLVGDAPCFVVSEALHLRRAAGLFAQEGIRVLPAPSGFAAPENTVPESTVPSFFPDPGSLGTMGQVVHETLGRMVAGLKWRGNADAQ